MADPNFCGKFFLPVLGQKRSQKSVSFEHFVISFFWNQSESGFIVRLDFPLQNPCMIKSSSCLIVWAALNQSHCKILEVRLSLSYMSDKSIALSLAWMGCPNFLKRINMQYIQKTRYGQVFFVYWTPVNRLSHEIAVFACSSHFHAVILLFFLGPIYFISLFVFSMKLH